MASRVFHRSLLLGLALLALGIGPLPAAAQPATEPIKIGVLLPLTGAVAVVGKGELNGMKLRLKELNNQMAGRKVEMIVEDDEGKPDVAVTKARKLVERDKVDVIFGPLLSHVVAAVQDYIGQKGVPQIVVVSQPPENAKYPTTLVAGWHAVQIGRIFGQYAYRKLGYKKLLIISSNYVYGRRVSDGFREGFTDAGGTIVKEVYPPLGNPDFAPFLTGLPQAEAVFSFFPGGDAIRYVKQRVELGLNERLPLLGIISTVDGILLPAQGDAALGSLAITHYVEDLDIPGNRRFVAAYAKEYGEPPLGYYPAKGYTIVQTLEEALKRTGGQTSPAERLITAFRQVDFESPQGRYRFDPVKPFPIMDFYIVKVVKKEGKPAYQVVDVMKEVKPE